MKERKIEKKKKEKDLPTENAEKWEFGVRKSEAMRGNHDKTLNILHSKKMIWQNEQRWEWNPSEGNLRNRKSSSSLSVRLSGFW